MLVDRGHLNYSLPISELWAEFSAHDKDDITLSDLMRHETGLQKFSFVLSARHHLQRQALKASCHVGTAIASAKQHPDHGKGKGKRSSSHRGSNQHPHDKPVHHQRGDKQKYNRQDNQQKQEANQPAIASDHTGSIQDDVNDNGSGDMTLEEDECRMKSRAYHAVTRGWIENEICMRADPQGRTLGELLRDWLARPLGLEGELTLGNETAENQDRIVPLVKIDSSWLIAQLFRVFDRRISLKSVIIAALLHNVSYAYNIKTTF